MPEYSPKSDEPGTGFLTDRHPTFKFRGGRQRWTVEREFAACSSDEPQQNPFPERLRTLRVDLLRAKRIDELEAKPALRQRFEVDREPGKAAHTTGSDVADLDVSACLGRESHDRSLASRVAPLQRTIPARTGSSFLTCIVTRAGPDYEPLSSTPTFAT